MPWTVSRQELYEQVWTTPIAQLAESEYRISGVALAKKCEKHKIPRPSRGYWAKKHAGHNPRKVPLPRIRDERLRKVSPGHHRY
jgi:hypothetical protein